MFSLPFTSGYTATVIADLYGHSSQRQPQDGPSSSEWAKLWKYQLVAASSAIANLWGAHPSLCASSALLQPVLTNPYIKGPHFFCFPMRSLIMPSFPDVYNYEKGLYYKSCFHPYWEHRELLGSVQITKKTKYI